MRRWLGRAILRIGGWRVDGDRPPVPKCVAIAWPHTSNWDFIWLIAGNWAIDLDIHWAGKVEMFRWPFGGILRRLGGIPVERRRRQNLVEQMVELIGREDELVLIIPAEGTRAWVPHWKSGFYHVARRAGVPIVTGFLDYATKTCGFGPPIPLTGAMAVDMDRIRAFYADVVAKYPECASPIRLVEERGDDAA